MERECPLTIVGPFRMIGLGGINFNVNIIINIHAIENIQSLQAFEKKERGGGMFHTPI